MAIAILVIALIAVILGSGWMVYAAMNGCFFASMWLAFGGMGDAAELVGKLIVEILAAIAESSN